MMKTSHFFSLWVFVPFCCCFSKIEASTASSLNPQAESSPLRLPFGAFRMPETNNRFWFYMDNLEKQIDAKLKNKELSVDKKKQLRALLLEAQEIKKFRVTFREVREYLEKNHNLLSSFDILDPHENGFN